MTLAMVLVVLPQSVPATADAAQGAAWEQLSGVPGPVTRLFAPTSGALFARVGASLYRTDDGGTAWRSVTLPALGDDGSSRQIFVDPGNHQRVYATGADGLYRTVDDAASWQPIWKTDADFPALLGFTASPAAPDLVYLVVGDTFRHVMKMMRSEDGGQTWTTLEQNGHQFLACNWGVRLLQAHPTDPDRVFRSIECHHAVSSSLLQESRDRGQRWDVIADTGGGRPESVQDPRVKPVTTPAPPPTGTIVPLSEKERPIGTAGLLVGGLGTMPTRFFLVVTRPDQGGGMSLLRTDDDGHVWNELLSYSGGGGATAADDTRPNVTVSDLTMDPQAPDHLFAAFHSQLKGQPATHAIRTSTDGGATWTDLAPPLAEPAFDLALGIDGRNLYAATATGVWRLALGI